MPTDRVVYKTGLATADLSDLADYLRAYAGPAVALRFVDAAE
ncbi:MAG TPA: hypothetical protein VD866_23250 [Urbifossiella sp.]|nr:hypothetical protein [Urbifossiella sp.]